MTHPSDPLNVCVVTPEQAFNFSPRASYENGGEAGASSVPAFSDRGRSLQRAADALLARLHWARLLDAPREAVARAAAIEQAVWSGMAPELAAQLAAQVPAAGGPVSPPPPPPARAVAVPAPVLVPALAQLARQILDADLDVQVEASRLLGSGYDQALDLDYLTHRLPQLSGERVLRLRRVLSVTRDLDDEGVCRCCGGSGWDDGDAAYCGCLTGLSLRRQDGRECWGGR